MAWFQIVTESKKIYIAMRRVEDDAGGSLAASAYLTSGWVCPCGRSRGAPPGPELVGVGLVGTRVNARVCVRLNKLDRNPTARVCVRFNKLDRNPTWRGRQVHSKTSVAIGDRFLSHVLSFLVLRLSFRTALVRR